jgi:hypothetical protein
MLCQPEPGALINPARHLVEAAVRNDGRDNATALLIEIG